MRWSKHAPAAPTTPPWRSGAATGQMVCWSNDALVKRCTGQMVYWSNRVLVKWCTGQIVHWSNAAPELSAYGRNGPPNGQRIAKMDIFFGCIK